MSTNAYLLLAAVAAAASVAVLRASWAQKQRSAALNIVGWGLIALAAVLGWLGAGMWGASAAAMVGMGGAGVALAIAGVTAPKGRSAASNRRVKMLPEAGEPRQIGQRVVTFLITVPLALIVSLGVAVAARGLADALGASPADSVTLAFFTAPLAWGILVHVLLIQQRRRGQWLALLVAALPAVPVVLTGVM